jgi:hypothetical protein
VNSTQRIEQVGVLASHDKRAACARQVRAGYGQYNTRKMALILGVASLLRLQRFVLKQYEIYVLIGPVFCSGI